MSVSTALQSEYDAYDAAIADANKLKVYGPAFASEAIFKAMQAAQKISVDSKDAEVQGQWADQTLKLISQYKKSLGTLDNYYNTDAYETAAKKTRKDASARLLLEEKAAAAASAAAAQEVAVIAATDAGAEKLVQANMKAAAAAKDAAAAAAATEALASGNGIFHRYVTAKSGLTIRADGDPQDKGKPIGKLSYGAEVHTMDNPDEWGWVRVPSAKGDVFKGQEGKYGWVSIAYLSADKPTGKGTDTPASTAGKKESVKNPYAPAKPPGPPAEGVNWLGILAVAAAAAGAFFIVQQLRADKGSASTSAPAAAPVPVLANPSRTRHRRRR